MLENKQHQSGEMLSVPVSRRGNRQHSSPAALIHGVSFDRGARRLSMLIGEYGTPWMIEHASYGALIPLIEEKFADHSNHPERLAVMYYCAGQTERAVKFVHDVLDSLRKRDNDTVLKQFERFAVPFLEMIDPEA